MTPYYKTESAIVLLLCSLQIITLSSIIISNYQSNSWSKDGIYYWSVSAFFLSCVSILISILGFFGITIDLLYQAWVVLLFCLNLIITVFCIHLFPSSNGWGTTGYVILIIACIFLNGFGTNSTLPISDTSYTFTG